VHCFSRGHMLLLRRPRLYESEIATFIFKTVLKEIFRQSITVVIIYHF
jgi:hypothetical protein